MSKYVYAWISWFIILYTGAMHLLTLYLQKKILIYKLMTVNLAKIWNVYQCSFVFNAIKLFGIVCAVAKKSLIKLPFIQVEQTDTGVVFYCIDTWVILLISATFIINKFAICVSLYKKSGANKSIYLIWIWNGYSKFQLEIQYILSNFTELQIQTLFLNPEQNLYEMLDFDKRLFKRHCASR